VPIEPLQLRIIKILKERRSPHSYVGGSSVFNLTYPRISDDLDIYSEDKPASKIAAADLAALEKAGLEVKSSIDHYGFAIEAIITDGLNQTIIEWNEADRTRFYPIQQHKTFGWTLHKADLAIQKLIAGATRRKARDAYDLILIDQNYMPLAIAAFAAPAKLPGVSPINILERARVNAIGIPAEDFEQIRLAEGSEKIGAGQLKLDLSDRIQNAIDQIMHSHPGAQPGTLYIDKKAKTHRLPTEENFASLQPHSASERGAIPRLGPITNRRPKGTEIGE
jgi:hypothetical protein